MVLQEKRVISLRKPKNWLAWHLGTVAIWLLTQFKNKFLPLPQLSQLSKSRAIVRSQCGVVGAQGCKQCEDCSIYCACHLGKAQAGRQAGVLPLSAQMASSGESVRSTVPALLPLWSSLVCLSLLPTHSHLCFCLSAPLDSLSRAASLLDPPLRPGGHKEWQSKCTGKHSKGNRGESCHFKIKQYTLRKKKNQPHNNLKHLLWNPFKSVSFCTNYRKQRGEGDTYEGVKKQQGTCTTCFSGHNLSRKGKTQNKKAKTIQNPKKLKASHFAVETVGISIGVGWLSQGEGKRDPRASLQAASGRTTKEKKKG